VAPTRSRARKGEGGRLRDEILRAAEGLLVETGSEEAVSIRAVADAVGVTPPSIYRHFEDKQLLIFEVCARQFARLDEVARAAIDGIDDPVVAVAALGRAYARFGLEHPEHYRIMFMGRSDLTPEQYADEVLADSGVFALLRSAVQRCLDAGHTVEGGGGALDAALVLWGAVHGITSLLIAKPGMPWGDAEAAIDRHCQVAMRGLFGVDASTLLSDRDAR
jgi:AcrR family transcriptional regulator